MCNSTGHSMDDHNKEMSILLMPNTIVLLLGCVLSVIGNTVVMYIHWKKLNTPESFRVFIPYLALSDCIGSVVSTFISVAHNFLWVTWSNQVTCKTAWGILKFVQATSFTFIFVIALQRYIRICRPFKTEVKRLSKCLYSSGFVAYVLYESVPQAFFANVSKNITNENVSFFSCVRYLKDGDDKHLHLPYRIIENVLQLVFVVTIIGLYIKSGMALSVVDKKVRISIQPSKSVARILDFSTEFREESSVTIGRSMFYTSPSNNASSEDINSTKDATNYGTTNRAYKKVKARNQKYKRINCMFFIISVVVIVTYIPRIVISIFEVTELEFWQKFTIHKFRHTEDPNLLVLVMIYRLYFVSFFINPIIYSIMDLEFRKELKNVCCSC